MAEKQEIVQPEQLHFKDDGVYPGSVLPVLLYRAAITADAQDRASVFERGFAQNDWRNSWRNGVYSFAHYHSTAHEALGVYSGSARLRLGGERPKSDHTIAALPIPDYDPIYGVAGPLRQIWKSAG